MTTEEATGQEKTVGDYLITYAVEEAADMYEEENGARFSKKHPSRYPAASRRGILDELVKTPRLNFTTLNYHWAKNDRKIIHHNISTYICCIDQSTIELSPAFVPA